jgi:hypothetical protein
MTIKGTVHHIGNTEKITDKFSKRLLVVKTDQEYNNLAPIEFTKDKTELLDSLQIGQSVSVEVNVGGREWQGKYFASITGWKIEAQARMESRIATAPIVATQPQQVADLEDSEELPF